MRLGSSRFAIFGLCLFLGLTVVAPAAGAPAGLERLAAADTDYVDLKDGRGTAVFKVRGGMFGHVGRGTLRVVDLPRGKQTTVSVDGAERVRYVNDLVTVYGGRELNFYIYGGWWRVQMKGRNIDASAVARGRLVLFGRSGEYQIDYGDWAAWPEERRIFRLG